MMMIHAVFSAKQDCQPPQSFIPINATSCSMLLSLKEMECYTKANQLEIILGLVEWHTRKIF